jgi:hypothetical protein
MELTVMLRYAFFSQASSDRHQLVRVQTFEREPRLRAMPKYDVTKLNVAIDKLLAVTTNPRHRFLLQAYSRHRYLEVAGRYEEIFAPDMMAPNPCYHFQAEGMHTRLEGQEAVKSLYRMWAETNQSIFYIENEQVAVADNFVASTMNYHQQLWGKSLTFNKATSYLPGLLAKRT